MRAERSLGAALFLAVSLVGGCGPKSEPAAPVTPPPADPAQSAPGSTAGTPGTPGAPSAPGAGTTPTPGSPSTPPGPRAGQREPAAPEPPEVRALNTGSKEFAVAVGKQSPAVVDHYDRLLKAKGWKERTPKGPNDPGQRSWMGTGAPVGPTDAFDAAWVNPKTGQTALLNLWHTAEDGQVQHGTFEIFARGRTPF